MNNVLTKKYKPKLLLSDFHEEAQLFVQEYSCPLCEGILYESVIDRCGHSYCRGCLVTLLKESPLCPFTNIEIIPKEKVKEPLLSNIVVNSVIEKQKVYCKNAQNCEWTGKLLELKSHLVNECEMELIDCEFAPECDLKVKRAELAEHVIQCPFRLVTCNYCQVQTNFDKVEEHYQSCAEFPIDCTNDCGLSLPSSKLDIHLESECEKAIVECPFRVVGCDFLNTRQELKSHLESELETHLKLLNNKIQNLEDLVSSQQENITTLTEDKIRLEQKVDKAKIENLKFKTETEKTLSLINKRMDNFTLYMCIPQSTHTPKLDLDSNQSVEEIFKLDFESNMIMKVQENYGWYGISLIPIVKESLIITNNFLFKNKPQKEKMIINMKIIKTSNHCIMFGLTLSKSKSPLQNGFYQQTEEENLSYMFYTYNNSVYHRGRAIFQGPAGPCIEGDVLSLIYDDGILSFRKNGAELVDSISIPSNNEELKFCLDLCDFEDTVMFI